MALLDQLLAQYFGGGAPVGGPMTGSSSVGPLPPQGGPQPPTLLPGAQAALANPGGGTLPQAPPAGGPNLLAANALLGAGAGMMAPSANPSFGNSLAQGAGGAVKGATAGAGQALDMARVGALGQAGANDTQRMANETQDRQAHWQAAQQLSDAFNADPAGFNRMLFGGAPQVPGAKPSVPGANAISPPQQQPQMSPLMMQMMMGRRGLG